MVCEDLLESLQCAGVSKAYIVLREGKWDIPARLGEGDRWGLDLAYRVLHETPSTPHSLDAAYPFTRSHRVLFGFPDILFRPRDAFVQLLARQEASGADVVLGVFPATSPEDDDMVDFDDSGHVRGLRIKAPPTDLSYSWIIAAWSPVFTEFIHTYLRSDPGHETGELYVGHVLQAAIEERLSVQAVPFPDGEFLDVGTPEKLARARRRYAASPV